MSKPAPTVSVDNSLIPEPGQGKRGEDGYLGYLLRQASNTHRLRMERAMADMGVTLPQFLVLTMIKAYPGVSNADLARLALLTPQTVSVIVTNLERSGAITRRPHAVHGRIQHIDVTPQGLTLLDACRQHSGGIEQELRGGFTQEEEQVVRRWLVHVATLGGDKTPA